MLIPRHPKQISIEGILDEVVDLKEKDIAAFFDLLINNTSSFPIYRCQGSLPLTRGRFFLRFLGSVSTFLYIKCG